MLVLSASQSCYEPRPVLARPCELGEGPLWCPDTQSVWFVDILGDAIYQFNPETRLTRRFETPGHPSFIVPDGGGNFIVGCDQNLLTFWPALGDFRLLSKVELCEPGQRLNDAALDRQGRLWFGTMDSNQRVANGKLLRYDNRGIQQMDSGYGIPNGPAFSPDGRTLYHCDSQAGCIYAFSLNEAGELGPRRLFCSVSTHYGHPDGLNVDSAGQVWVGLFGGWGVNCYSPGGHLVRHIPFPVPNVTKIAFGGPALKTAFATTARTTMSPRERATRTTAGNLFSFEVEVAGLPQPEGIHV